MSTGNDGTEGVMVKGLSRKQAGVIYGNWKRGNLESTQEVMGWVYDFSEMFASNVTDREMDMLRSLRDCIDAIFANDYEAAQGKLERFAGLHRMMWA